MEQYSELMTDIIVMYNYHKAFLENKGRVTTRQMRGHYKKMEEDLHVISQSCWKVTIEENVNRKLRKKFQVEQNKYNKIHRKLNPAKMGRPRQDKTRQEEQYGIRLSRYFRKQKEKENKK
jgi:hypothetical protein